MNRCPHCGHVILEGEPSSHAQQNAAAAMPLTFMEYAPPVAAAGGFAPSLRLYEFTVHAARAILVVLALALAGCSSPRPLCSWPCPADDCWYVCEVSPANHLFETQNYDHSKVRVVDGLVYHWRDR